MNGPELLIDAFDRIKLIVHRSVEGLTEDDLAVRLDADANSIGWLVWHLTRNQDDHVADVAGTDQVYVNGGWWERMGRPFDVQDTGYGQTSKQVGSLRFPNPQLLLDYHDAVHSASVGYVHGQADKDFDRVVDTNWDPVVTLGVRLISVLADGLQHAGQAAYVRGIISRR
jgi:hypothetical protein